MKKKYYPVLFNVGYAIIYALYWVRPFNLKTYGCTVLTFRMSADSHDSPENPDYPGSHDGHDRYDSTDIQISFFFFLS